MTGPHLRPPETDDTSWVLLPLALVCLGMAALAFLHGDDKWAGVLWLVGAIIAIGGLFV